MCARSDLNNPDTRAEIQLRASAQPPRRSRPRWGLAPQPYSIEYQLVVGLQPFENFPSLRLDRCGCFIRGFHRHSPACHRALPRQPLYRPAIIKPAYALWWPVRIGAQHEVRHNPSFHPHRARQEDAVRRARLHSEQSGGETARCHPCPRTHTSREIFSR